MKKYRCNHLVAVLSWVFCLFFLLGCVSSEKTQDIEMPPAAVIQWPATEPAVTYVKSITTFKSQRRSIWDKISAVVTGKGEGETRIVKPVAVSVSLEGSIVVADPANGMVHYYIASEKRYLRISRVKEGEELASPVGVAFDKRMRLFISDSVRKKVYAFDRSGTHLFSIEGPEDGLFQRPTGVAYHGEKDLLYISDTVADRISMFDTDGRFVASFGEEGILPGQFNFPTHIFSDDHGRLYVTDTMNFRVQVFTASGEFITLFGHHGDGSGDFAMPKGIAADRRGTIYVVDSLFDNVQLFDRDGRLLLTVGQQGTAPGEFWLPSGIFIDHRGYLYVCDTYNRRVQVFKLEDYQTSEGKTF